MHAAPLFAGVSRATITPPVGIAMSGFAGRGAATGVHDDLYATALALRCGETSAVLISLDLIFAPEDVTAGVRTETARRTGVPDAHVFLCASHTHYGPALGLGPDAEPMVAAYTANLVHLLAGAAELAVRACETPARVGWGVGQSAIGINRRERREDGSIWLGNNPDGPCDREVRVIRLDGAAGQPLAALASFACHGVCAAHQMRDVSADFIGPARRAVESLTGRRFLYLQGACGNINPVRMEYSHEPARQLGTALGGEALRLLELARPESASGLAVASETIELPAKTFATAGEGEQACAVLRDEVARLAREGAESGSVWWAQSRLRRAEEMLSHVRAGTDPPPVRAEVAALRFGDVALAIAPGEPFCEIGMEVKERSPIARTCFVGYSNGSIGYVPVSSAYAEGGYEVTHASRVGPGAAAALTEGCLRVLDRVSSRS